MCVCVRERVGVSEREGLHVPAAKDSLVVLEIGTKALRSVCQMDRI